MRRYLLDSGIAGDYINRRRGVFERAKSEVALGNQIGIGTPVLGELVAGLEMSASKEWNAKLLERAIAAWTLWPFGPEAAREFGRISAGLRRAGRRMQQIDVQVAAIAIQLGRCTVVTTDSDLGAVPGLKVEDWRS